MYAILPCLCLMASVLAWLLQVFMVGIAQLMLCKTMGVTNLRDKERAMDHAPQNILSMLAIVRIKNEAMPMHKTSETAVLSMGGADLKHGCRPSIALVYQRMSSGTACPVKRQERQPCRDAAQQSRHIKHASMHDLPLRAPSTY